MKRLGKGEERVWCGRVGERWSGRQQLRGFWRKGLALGGDCRLTATSTDVEDI